ncbi:MAG TPA: HAD family phosphatase [Cyclobacteriaceae bacterium]|nr:HAD family phosphatase [Cyclobacteriaceae bacterium]
MNSVETVIFDLGGVLIDWNPRYLYRKIFKSEEEIDWFLNNICTAEWNDMQDAGRNFAEGTEELLSKHPDWEMPIRAWYSRWEETISGPIEGTVEILRTIKGSGHRLYALTNWSAESFPIALQKFDFLNWFQGIVVSGVEKTRKPFPDIYRILFDRYAVEPGKSVFIDDNLTNIKAAKNLGLNTIHFTSPEQLRGELRDYKITV